MNKPFSWSLVLILILLSGFQLCSSSDIDNELIADAIYRAEGGAKASVPYGVLSVKVKDEVEARQVCLNTIRNTKKRWEKAGKPDDFITFLGRRYCPVNCDNDNGTNQYWVKNVRFWIKKLGDAK